MIKQNRVNVVEVLSGDSRLRVKLGGLVRQAFPGDPVAKYIDRGRRFLLVENAKYVGFVTYVSSNGKNHISGLYVDPLVRGRGYGKLLLQHVVDLSKTDQIDRVVLGVEKHNTAAVELYLKFGFLETKSGVEEGKEFILMEYRIN